MCLLTCHSSCRVFWWNIKSPRWLSPLQPRFGALQLLAFPKTKISSEREEISGHQWDSGKYDWAADGNWKNCVRSVGAYSEAEWGIIVLWTMFLVSSSINVSSFHSAWLDTFWTDLVNTHNIRANERRKINTHVPPTTLKNCTSPVPFRLLHSCNPTPFALQV